MRENSFAAPVVKVQTERGHRVVSSGPYAVVRHPMYSGGVVFFAGAALLLGSWWGVAMSPLYKHAIRHQLCVDCGVEVFAHGRKPDGSEVIALNVSCIDGIELSKLTMTPVDGRNM
jgi:hypothetical protein